MATKPAQSEDSAAPSGESSDAPLLDISDAAVKKLIKAAKKRGYVTYGEINAVLPPDQVSSEQIEDTMAMFSDMGVNVVESDEAEEGEDAAAKKSPAVVTQKAVVKTTNSSASERTDDPVRMYLREMGTVELLSREGEIAIAKRIEAGREAMIAGLCESPLTFQAIIIWRDELNEGRILLRDIIDLSATYAGPDAKQTPVARPPDGEGAQGAQGAQLGTQGAGGETGQTKTNGAGLPETGQYAKAPAPESDKSAGDGDAQSEGEEDEDEEDDEDDEDLENSLSLAAMEAELKPDVLKTFNQVAGNYKKLRRLQDQLVEKALKRDTLSTRQKRRYGELKQNIVVANIYKDSRPCRPIPRLKPLPFLLSLSW